MNRREKRMLKEQINMFSNVVTIIKQYFPALTHRLEQLTDVRHQSYVEYQMSVVTVTRLLGLLCGMKSMRSVTEQMNTHETIKNISQLLNVELEELPHYDTINNVFETLNIEELRKIQKYMLIQLIRSKMFDKFRINGKYFQVVIDGTRILNFKERHCKHCLKAVHNKGKENEYTTYYHYVLEAKLVVGEIVISMYSEFVENENEDIEKQDCELKAFYRIAKIIKKEYPKLPIIISGDALYASKPVMKICKDNNWQYILRFKSDKMKSLAEEIEGLEQIYEEQESTIKYWNEVVYSHNKHILPVNILKYYEKDKQFTWIVSFNITKNNVHKLIYFGRQRWKIENQGFNIQKNHTFDIEHRYSNNYNAIKVHYFFIQFAHTIRQLLEKGVSYVRELKMSLKEVSAAITQTLTYTITNPTPNTKMQLRFELKLSI